MVCKIYKAVIDTNIIISALRGKSDYSTDNDLDFNSTPPKIIYKAIVNGRVVLVSSEEQIEELKDVTHRDIQQSVMSRSFVGLFINLINRSAIKVVTKPLSSKESNDSKDDFLIELCESGIPDVLVTGDKKSGLLKRGTIGSADVMTADQFVERYLLEPTKQSTLGSIDEFMKLNGDYFTIQVIEGAFKRSALSLANSLRGHNWIIQEGEDNAPSYLLLTGCYATKQSANSVAMYMQDCFLFKDTIAVKQIKEIQDKIRLNNRINYHKNKRR